MRKRVPNTVVTFATTSDALAFESVARERAIPGRTIPVPSEIDAGCGLAWCVCDEDRAALLTALDEYGLAFEGVFEVLMY